MTAEKTINTGQKAGKKRRLRLAVAAVIAAALAFGAVLAGANAWVCADARGHIVPQEEAQPADAIIVLGAKVWDQGQPSYMLKDRLDVAYELWAAGVSNRILVSGDHGSDDYDEVNNMRRYLEDRGVPTDIIFMDHAGFDTYSTMYRARDVFVVKSAVVVTQQYHLYRAVFLARSMGLEAQGVACDRYVSKRQPYYDAREFAARVKDFFLAKVFRPEPKYLGDELPISGSGIITHDREE